MSESRTKKSMKNAQVSLVYYVIQLILGFFSRKVFFDYLGSEILGLHTTAANLLGFLNLAELGIGMSIGFFLYKPLYEKDIICLNKIITLQGWLYRRIAVGIIIMAAILMCFFPWIFDKTPLPLWYAYTTFGVLLFSSMLGYFANYRQIILQADQKNYKVQRITQGAIVIKTVVQIIGMPYVVYPFLFWVLMEVVFSIFSAFVLNYVLKREYPWLSSKEYDGHKLVKEFPDIIKKTKQVFVHKLSGVILAQCTPFIMYAFSSLTVVAYYGNYQLIVGKTTYLMQMVFNSTTAGVGNLVASNNRKHIKDVFWELFDSRLYVSSVILLTTYFIITPFIVLWLGKGYILSENLLILVLLSAFISINRVTVDSYIAGYGLFSDVWAPISEAILNIGGSIIFGYLYGFEGVLLGNVISQIIIICLWKPYFLFTKGFGETAYRYFLSVASKLLLIMFCYFIINTILQTSHEVEINNFLDWSLYSSSIFLIVSIFLFVEFYSVSRGFRSFSRRVFIVANAKFKNREY